ncbi:hypothetical protein [Ideonella sp. A 288]|uniref:hypothetical protein n=1 Tax=Ideonella sp. A 288 TaxID=1962181 RepID=UPI001186E3DB|nr:hypothetical protein [Ideonella sp. A 288]
MALALAWGAGPVHADPLKSPACVQAVAALDDVERAMASASASQARGGAADPALTARLRDLRHQAARLCLGSAPDETPRALPRVPARTGQAEPRGLQPKLAAAAVGPRVPAPPAIAPFRSITSCDAAGCWASDGTRLQKMGPDLLGPNGLCRTVGTVLTCP